jgi:hypothetical protein
MASLLASPAVRQIVARLNKSEPEEQVKEGFDSFGQRFSTWEARNSTKD